MWFPYSLSPRGKCGSNQNLRRSPSTCSHTDKDWNPSSRLISTAFTSGLDSTSSASPSSSPSSSPNPSSNQSAPFSTSTGSSVSPTNGTGSFDGPAITPPPTTSPSSSFFASNSSSSSNIFNATSLSFIRGTSYGAAASAYSSTLPASPGPSAIAATPASAISTAHTSHAGAIAGGIIGGGLLALVLGLGAFWWRRVLRRRRRQLAPSAEFMSAPARPRSRMDALLPFARRDSISDGAADTEPPPAFTPGAFGDPVLEKVRAAEAERNAVIGAGTSGHVDEKADHLAGKAGYLE